MACPGILSNFVGILRSTWRPQIEAKRYRYWKEMRERGYQRRYGWKDTLPRGLLPRIDGEKYKTLPVYRAKNSFSQKRATLGQNDYIDILGKYLFVSRWNHRKCIFPKSLFIFATGDSNLHPARIVTGVPTWLKTFRGNEFQRLLRKEKMYDRGIYPLTRPTKWSKMKTRMDWLWYELNYRRKFHWCNVAYMCQDYHTNM